MGVFDDIGLEILARNQTYWPVVDESNVHHCCEYAVFDLLGFIELANPLVERFIEVSGLFSTGRLMKVWFVAFLE
jgi:hypothetical protein